MAEASSSSLNLCCLCDSEVTDSDLVVVGDIKCCRSCSPSIRNDGGLVEYFVGWHENNVVPDLKVTRKPEILESQRGVAVAVCEFEMPDLVGSIIIRADGQCDIDVFRVSDNESVLCSYTVLNSKEEVANYLVGIYENIRREQDAAPQIRPR